MPHTECAHKQAQMQISNESLPSSCSGVRLIRPTGYFFSSKSKALHEERGLHIETQPIQTPGLHFGRGVFYYTSQSLSTVLEFSLGMSTAARFLSFSVLLVSPFCASLQVPVFEVPVLEGEPLLLPLAPFLIVKVNVSALQEDSGREEALIKSNQEVSCRYCVEIAPVQTHR